MRPEPERGRKLGLKTLSPGQRGGCGGAGRKSVHLYSNQRASKCSKVLPSFSAFYGAPDAAPVLLWEVRSPPVVSLSGWTPAPKEPPNVPLGSPKTFSGLFSQLSFIFHLTSYKRKRETFLYQRSLTNRSMQWKDSLVKGFLI